MRATRLKYRAFSVVSLESGGSGVLSVPHSRLETAMRSRAVLDERLVSDCALERWANVDTEAVARLGSAANLAHHLMHYKKGAKVQY